MKLLGLLACVLSGATCAVAELPLISLDGFRDSAGHWRNIRDTNRFIQATAGQASYAPAQVREVVANILLFQRINGGWPKDYDMTAVLNAEQRATVMATRSREDTSFDNHNIHSQVEYLGRAVAAGGDATWRTACERGFDFMLAAQYPNGGFPQRFPNAKSYYAHITFNDGVMVGILEVLQDAALGRPHFAWLDEVRRGKAREAVRRGVDCILKCQIRVDGQLTGWCQQHDEKTFEARPARTFELASICPQDTTEAIRFLMRQDRPAPEVLQATDAAIAWLMRVQLTGLRTERVKTEAVAFEKHTADFDVVVVKDDKAPPLWARYYEIGTGRPTFAGRDGVKKYSLAEIHPERRTGMPWYGRWPAQLIEREYPAWRKRLP